ncbi:hypothetical protein POM88_046572 [Heracleum sosnowskyi]|uniref:Uncharacterized protein n=1 Tax=Heracleum sosnowskyi TaxID=360622 RepID=A0AAD8H9G9_9APIA|nr:hypothetical protein POM88_046572 [Heracleum sosnowskyi]
MRQYWIEDLVREEESEEGFEVIHEQQPQEEHEPYYLEQIEHHILDDDMEEANPLSLEQEAALERLKVEKAERDARQAEKETHQAVQRNGLEVNDNAEVEVIIQDIRSANQEDDTYFTALRHSPIFLKAGVKTNGVILIKIQRTTRLNELLREHVKEILMKVSPEISENPPMVRFMKNDLFRIYYLTKDKLKDYPNNYLISVEKYLRSTGFTSTEKDKATDTLRRYLMENVPYYRKRVERGLEVHPRLPNMPKLNQKDVNTAWLWAGVGQEVEYIARHIKGTILKPGESLHYPSVIDYQASNSNPVVEEGEIEMD